MLAWGKAPALSVHFPAAFWRGSYVAGAGG